MRARWRWLKRGKWGPHKGIPAASAGFAKTQSHALRRTSFCSIADKLVSQLASFPVGDLRIFFSLSKAGLQLSLDSTIK
jgi:hypothetical protein